MDGALPSGSWYWRLVDALSGSDRRDRVQSSVLLGSALDPDGSAGLRDAGLDPADGPGSAVPVDTDPRSVEQLKRDAEALETRLQGLLNRGPVQSRVAWERELERTESALEATWLLWANRVDPRPVQQA